MRKGCLHSSREALGRRDLAAKGRVFCAVAEVGIKGRAITAAEEE